LIDPNFQQNLQNQSIIDSKGQEIGKVLFNSNNYGIGLINYFNLEDYKIKIGNIKNLDKTKLHLYCLNFGKLKYFHLCSKTLSYVFVQFDDKSIDAYFLRTRPHMMDGTILLVKDCQTEQDPTFKQKLLLLSNISSLINEYLLCAYFSTHGGQILNCVINKDDKHNNDGFIEFKHSDEAIDRILSLGDQHYVKENLPPVHVCDSNFKKKPMHKFSVHETSFV